MNYCPKCGFEAKEMKFCPKCGFRLDDQDACSAKIDKVEYEEPNSANKQNNESSDAKYELKRELRATLVKTNTERYIPAFESLDKNGGSNWNWCAFFFTPIWFAYRKLYKWAVIAYAAYFALGIIFAFIGDGSGTSIGVVERICLFAVSAVFATKADSIYRNKIDKLISYIPENVSERKKYIGKNSGTSILGMIVTILILVACYALNVILMIS